MAELRHLTQEAEGDDGGGAGATGSDAILYPDEIEGVRRCLTALARGKTGAEFSLEAPVEARQCDVIVARFMATPQWALG